MAYGVRDELADRVQDSMRRRIAYGGALSGETHCNGCRACDGCESLAYRLGEVRFVQNVAAKVPQAPPEIRAAGADHLRDGVETPGRGGILAAECVAGGRDLISDRGEVLRKRIVQIGRKTRAFGNAQLRHELSRLDLYDFAAFPLNKHAQGRVPEKNEHDESAHCAYGDNELRRRPPWRTFQENDVVRTACNKEEAFISRERQGWPPEAGVEHTHACGRNEAADFRADSFGCV